MTLAKLGVPNVQENVCRIALLNQVTGILETSKRTKDFLRITRYTAMEHL